jgi:opacity protein-like surface antigen
MSKRYRQKKLRYLFWLLLFCTTFNETTFATSSVWKNPDSYLGFYLGGAVGSIYAGPDVGSVNDTAYFTSGADINTVNAAGTSIRRPRTAIAGIEAGHDWVWKRIVYGMAMDYGVMSLNGSYTQNNRLYSSSSDQFSIHTEAKTKQLFTLRGRLGFSTKLHWPSLFYATGGVAITRFAINNTFSDNAALQGSGSVNNNLYELGWTGGVGVDVAALTHLLISLEYLFVDIPGFDTTGTITNLASGFGTTVGSLSNPFTVTNKFHANLVKIGLNYRFDE